MKEESVTESLFTATFQAKSELLQFGVCMGYESCREAMIKIWKTLKVDNFF